MDEQSDAARQVLAAYRHARAADPAVHARVRGRIAGSIEARVRVETNRRGRAITVALLVAAVVVLVVGAMWTGLAAREHQPNPAPSAAQRDALPRTDHPVHATTPPAELPPSLPAVERDDTSAPQVVSPSRGPSPRPDDTSSGGDADLQRELELLREAKEHRERGDTKRSLAVLATHAREFPRGQLGEERDAIAIEIRCKTAERPRARRELETFAATHPSSTHLDRLRRACE